MKTLSIFIILTGSLLLTACDETQVPKIKNPFAGHVDALQKAKDLKLQIEDATDKKMKQLNGLN
jgi:hypothetical protein